MTQTIIGALRVRNESRWIRRVIQSIKPVCETILVLDDNSDDDTADICESEGCRVFRGSVPWVNAGGRLVSDESAGKQFLLSETYKLVPQQYYGRHDSPFWSMSMDGDEVLVTEDQSEVRRLVENPSAHCYSIKILYLWDREDQWRVDGVYGRFARPSLFRLINPNFNYKTTPFGNGANFHCSSIPQEMLHHARPSNARLLHFGYIDRDLRLRKYEFYNRIDPANDGEGRYLHCIQGDVPEVPADAMLKWAGPMEFAKLP